MLSLNSRPLSAKNGTLLVSLSSGRVQVWSHHHTVESCITDFNAVHVAGDVSKWLIDVHLECWSWCIHFSFFFLFVHFHARRRKNKTILFSTLPPPLPSWRKMSVTAMASDTQNCYLFTGSARGYIKAWMIVNFWYVFNCDIIICRSRASQWCLSRNHNFSSCRQFRVESSWKGWKNCEKIFSQLLSIENVLRSVSQQRWNLKFNNQNVFTQYWLEQQSTRWPKKTSASLVIIICSLKRLLSFVIFININQRKKAWGKVGNAQEANVWTWPRGNWGRNLNILDFESF